MDTNSLYRIDQDTMNSGGGALFGAPLVAIAGGGIMLDLDQTLIATQDDMESPIRMAILSKPELLPLRNRYYEISLEDIHQPGAGTRNNFWGIIRPHVREFLIFCFSYFKLVIVWSAAKRPYVEAIVDILFRDIRPPHIVFTSDDCLANQQGLLTKPLQQLIDSNPVLKRYISLADFYTLDDNPITFIHNPGNEIQCPPYNPPMNLNALMAEQDPTLLQIMAWLLQPEVRTAKDIRLLDKSTIFTTPLSAYNPPGGVNFR